MASSPPSRLVRRYDAGRRRRRVRRVQAVEEGFGGIPILPRRDGNWSSGSVQLQRNVVDVEVAPGESLLSVLRATRDHSAKDGRAPQGQCGCCTVLVDGEPRCGVTPVTGWWVARSRRSRARSSVRDELAAASARAVARSAGSAPRASSCAVAAARAARRRPSTSTALAAHLCRCTGWQTISPVLASESGVVRVF
jgi:hypothetical protein